MKEIILTHGKVTIVDNEDYEYLNKHNWYLSAYGYAVNNTIEDKPIFLHRLIMNCPEGMDIDHINGNRLDNRKENLRICTRKQNLWNMKKKSNSTSKYKGVSWAKDRNKWRAFICVDGKRKSIGSFDTEIEAAKAYNEKAIEYFGEYAWLNEVL